MAFDRRAASTQSQRALNSPIRPVIFRPTIGRLVHPHARELHKARFRVLPDPDGDIFHRLIFPVPGLHSGNGDRVFRKKAERFFHVEEIHYEPGARIDGPVQHDLDAIGMTVRPMTRCVCGTFGNRCAASNLNT